MTVNNIVILTGAGISQESGVETFRCAGGVWSRFRLDDVATPQGFAANPELVQRFYNDRRRGLKDPAIQPNPAHLALARLEQSWTRGTVLIVTQNIDDLHERAGSQSLIHMHGELLKIRCTHCDRPFAWHEDLTIEHRCPDCQQRGRLRPHVVWFGEVPLEMERIYKALQQCDLFISIGTSGHVYPAAGFVAMVQQMGRADTVELNLEPSEGSYNFDRCIHGKASAIVPDFVEALLAS